MSYNLKSIKRDLQGSPIPQFFNPTADDFQPLTGVALGGGRYASDVLGWGKTAGGLYVPLKVGNNGELYIVPTDSAGAEKFTNANPGNVQLTGSSIQKTNPIFGQRISNVIVSTIINAQSVAAGSNTGFVSPGLDGTESFVVFLINIDQQPWTADVVNIVTGYTLGAYGLYPKAQNVTTAYPNTSLPFSTIFIPLAGVNIIPASITDAISLATTVNTNYPTSGQIKIINNSSSTATVTVRVVRVWR